MVRKKQKEIFDYITSYQRKNGYAPSLEEIRKKFKLASVSTAHFHIKRLREEGYIIKGKNKVRGIETRAMGSMVKIPLLGTIAAGEPIEAIENRETIAVPIDRIPRTGNLFALTVRGDSMIEDNIHDGDVIVVRQQATANEGETVVALIDNENATVKKIYREKGKVRLQPVNRYMSPLLVKPQQLKVQGVVVDVIGETHKRTSPTKLEAPSISNRQKPHFSLRNKSGVAYEGYLGDSLDILPTLERKFKTIYLDPPFNTNRDYAYSALGERFGFIDAWGEGEYERWLNSLIASCKSKLLPNGTLFLHISAELSLVPNIILQKHFKKVEPIFWKKAHGKNTVKNKLGSVIDIIYKASDNGAMFNLLHVPLDEYYLENSYRNKDAVGLYALGSIKHDKTRSGHFYTFEKDGITYKAPYGWKIPREKLEILLKQDRIHFTRPKKDTREGMLYKKLYKHEVVGKPLSNLWDDIHYITRTTQDERLYPTQKPTALLKRIIELSSNPGDWVLDPVAGSGTTGAAALLLDRPVTLIDSNKEALPIIKKRLQSLDNQLVR